MSEIERFVALPTDKITRQVRALGIDLGTTNSTVSEVVWEPGNAPVCTVLELAQPIQAGEYTSPFVPSNLLHEKNLFTPVPAYFQLNQRKDILQALNHPNSDSGNKKQITRLARYTESLIYVQKIFKGLKSNESQVRKIAASQLSQCP